MISPIRRIVLACFALVATAIGIGAAQGALLELPTTNPDIFVDYIKIDNIGTSFSASGTPMTLDGVGPGQYFNDGSFLLSANILASEQATSGTVAISGDTGTGLSTLLLGELLQFGSTTQGEKTSSFEFLFMTTGGTLQSNYGPYFVVLLHSGGNLPQDWAFGSEFHSFDTALAPYADVKAVATPEPASLAIWGGLCAVGMTISRWRRRRSLLEAC